MKNINKQIKIWPLGWCGKLDLERSLGGPPH